MPNVKTQFKLHTLIDFGRAIGTCQSTMHRWKNEGIIPPPNCKVGKRHYYTDERFQELVKQFEDGTLLSTSPAFTKEEE